MFEIRREIRRDKAQRAGMSRLNRSGKLNQTVRGERGRESKKGTADPERQPGPGGERKGAEGGKRKPSPREGGV